MRLNANFKRFSAWVLSGILAATLYEIGHYIVTGQTDIVHTLRFTINYIVGGSIGLWIAIKVMKY